MPASAKADDKRNGPYQLENLVWRRPMRIVPTKRRIHRYSAIDLLPATTLAAFPRRTSSDQAAAHA